MGALRPAVTDIRQPDAEALPSFESARPV